MPRCSSNTQKVGLYTREHFKGKYFMGICMYEGRLEANNRSMRIFWVYNKTLPSYI